MDIHIRNIFNTIYSREVEYKGTVDILLQACPNHILEDHHKVVVLRSNLGILWEHIFCLFGYHKLMYGADLVNHSTKVIMELKNSEKSDNASSKKANMKKLIEYCKMYLENILSKNKCHTLKFNKLLPSFKTLCIFTKSKAIVIKH